jgi:hypothetical protein
VPSIISQCFTPGASPRSCAAVFSIALELTTSLAPQSEAM